jgi:flagellar hook-associated protein 3 FlgL
MRVTFNSLNDGVASLNVAAAALDRAQDQLSSGKRLRAASDDPAAAQRGLASRADIATLDAYTRAGESAEARLTALDTVLTDVVERLTEAKAAATAARGSTATPESREAVALQIEGIRDAIVSGINTKVGGTALFSGAEALSTPYARVGGAWVYQGDASTVSVATASSRSVRISMDGQGIIQGSDAASLFTEMDALATAIRAGDEAGISAGVAALDRGFDRTVRAQSSVGIDLNGLEDDHGQIAALRLASKKRLSKDEDADLSQAATDLARADTAYRAALSAVSTAGRLSLMDYLR